MSDLRQRRVDRYWHEARGVAHDLKESPKLLRRRDGLRAWSCRLGTDIDNVSAFRYQLTGARLGVLKAVGEAAVAERIGRDVAHPEERDPTPRTASKTSFVKFFPSRRQDKNLAPSEESYAPPASPTAGTRPHKLFA